MPPFPPVDDFFISSAISIGSAFPIVIFPSSTLYPSFVNFVSTSVCKSLSLFALESFVFLYTSFSSTANLIISFAFAIFVFSLAIFAFPNIPFSPITMFRVTPARIRRTIMVITKATSVIAVLDVRMFDIGLFVCFCFICGSSGTPTPTWFDFVFSNVLILYLFTPQFEAFSQMSLFTILFSLFFKSLVYVCVCTATVLSSIFFIFHISSFVFGHGAPCPYKLNFTILFYYKLFFCAINF